MGCVQGKGPTTYTPLRGITQILKSENGYYVEGERDAGSGQRVCENASEMVEKIVADEMVDGWPKWLLKNVPKDKLAGLVPKTADSYDKLAKIGQGTYSNVYKARDRDTGKIVALKKVRFDITESESVKFMAREIIMLRQLDHPNIIKLEGIATSRVQYSLYLVFDYMQTDLSRVISRQQGKLTEPQVKCYMQHLLSGLQHCHEKGILHRDIKGSNLLIDANGMLKIADFGLANFFEPTKKGPLTSRVVTLWYRAPELLLGRTDYGVGIDLWSAGCLFAEMFVGKPILSGRTEVEQLHRIFKLSGSPSEEYWKKMKPSTMFGQPEQYKPSFHETFSDILPPSSFKLLTTLLSLEPEHRGTATLALQDEFFISSPLACDLSGLPVINKEEDEPIPSTDQKGHFHTKKKVQKKHGDHKRKVSFPNQVKESGSVNEVNNSKPNLLGQETGKRINATCFDEKRISTSSVNETDRSLPPSPFSTFRSNQIRTAKTLAHPNAMKNIQNFPLLLASLADRNPIMIREDCTLALNRRSRSSVDLRTASLDPISNTFGMQIN